MTMLVGMSDEESIDREFYRQLRRKMVEKQIVKRDVTDPAVIKAMHEVPRHLFVIENQTSDAYSDCPLPIGYDQTISQPYVVASMTEHLALGPDSRVLEVGTGSGYQTAVLSLIAREIYTIEIIPQLHDRAVRLFARLGYSGITARCGDGSAGWIEKAPYNGIIVTAAAPKLPVLLVEQLAVGGRLIIPLGHSEEPLQSLYLIEKTTSGIEERYLYDVRFVPMRGSIES